MKSQRSLRKATGRLDILTFPKSVCTKKRGKSSDSKYQRWTRLTSRGARRDSPVISHNVGSPRGGTSLDARDDHDASRKPFWCGSSCGSGTRGPPRTPENSRDYSFLMNFACYFSRTCFVMFDQKLTKNLFQFFRSLVFLQFDADLFSEKGRRFENSKNPRNFSDFSYWRCGKLLFREFWLSYICLQLFSQPQLTESGLPRRTIGRISSSFARRLVLHPWE